MAANMPLEQALPPCIPGDGTGAKLEEWGQLGSLRVTTLPRKGILGPLGGVWLKFPVVQQLLLSRGTVRALEEAEGSRSREINRDQSVLMAGLGLQGCGFACRQGFANLCKVLSNGNVPLHFIWQRFNFANQEFQAKFEISYLDQTIQIM